MTCLELYQKISDGMQSHVLEVNEGIGCGDCPYYDQGKYDHISEENDWPCYKKLEGDEKSLKRILAFIDKMYDFCFLSNLVMRYL